MPTPAPSATPPLRLGVVGTGYIANVMGAALRETARVRVTAVASRVLERAADFAMRHAVDAPIRPSDDWRALVASADIDAVYIATPTSARTAIALAAAAHGKHVLAEKPFTDAASVSAITEACRANGVAFLDATHFVHHPRHALLRATLTDRIGTLLALNASFTFPSMDRSNVRHDPSQEPTGAWGDMAWYVMRAVVEFTPDESALAHASGVARRDAQSGAVVRSAGLLALDSGCTATWDVAYDIGTCLMDLHLMGSAGRVRMDDFVLDWAGGFAIPIAGHVADWQWQSGVVNREGIVTDVVPSGQRQVVRMLEHFAGLAAAPDSAAATASARASLRTQSLLDAVWARHVIT